MVIVSLACSVDPNFLFSDCDSGLALWFLQLPMLVSHTGYGETCDDVANAGSLCHSGASSSGSVGAKWCSKAVRPPILLWHDQQLHGRQATGMMSFIAGLCT